MLRKFLTAANLSQCIGIDLGTQNTVVADPTGKILLNEPTLICRNTKTGELYYGNDAKERHGRVSNQFEFIWPLQDGIIQAEQEQLVTGFLGHIMSRNRWLPKPNVVIAISCLLAEKDLRNVDSLARSQTASL